MKIKLLKKIRKRFTIIHFPKGIRIGETFCNYNVFKLTDNQREYYSEYCELTPFRNTDEKVYLGFCQAKASTEQECINILLEQVKKSVRSAYPHLGAKGHIRIPKTKVWYNIKQFPSE